MHACGAALGQRPDEHLAEVVQCPQSVVAGGVGPHVGVGRQLHRGGAGLSVPGADAAQVLAALAQPQGAACGKGSCLSLTRCMRQPGPVGS